MEDFFSTLLETTDVVDIFFVLSLAFSILVMLYAMTLMSNRLRVLEGELQSVRKDISVINEELEEIVKIKVNQARSN